MKKNFYSLSTFFLLSLSLLLTACSKEKQLLPTDSPKITNATETAKTVSILKTETTATTYGKIVTVAFNSVTDGFDVQLINTSTAIDKKNYKIASYDWDFGDGKTETSPDNKPFTHNYTAIGNYNVKLSANVVDAVTEAPVDGPFIATKRINVVAIVPTASFNVNYSPDGLTAILNNTSTNGATYSWDFNDGGTSTLQNPTHLYAKEGTYTVKLTVTSKTGNTISTTQTVTIDATPIADFDFGVATSGFTDFTNKSIKGVTYLWSFGDGDFDTTFNAKHTYKGDGNYPVILTVKGATGKTSTKYKVVSIRIKPIVDFSFTKKDTLIGRDTLVIVKFTNLSRNAVSYNWNFGDGATSVAENPIHLYKFFATYTVQLTATSISGKNDSKWETIRLP